MPWHPRRMETMSLRRYRNEHGLWCSRIGTDDRVDAARLQLLQELLGCVSRMAQTREVTRRFVLPQRLRAPGHRHYARRDRLRRLEPLYRPARHPIHPSDACLIQDHALIAIAEGVGQADLPEVEVCTDLSCSDVAVRKC